MLGREASDGEIVLDADEVGEPKGPLPTGATHREAGIAGSPRPVARSMRLNASQQHAGPLQDRFRAAFPRIGPRLVPNVTIQSGRGIGDLADSGAVDAVDLSVLLGALG